MDIRVQELLEKIKKDGVEAAQAEAALIIASANERKAAIMAEAEREARGVETRAREQAARAEEAGKATIAQASRNLVLAFRDEIGKVLQAIVKTEVESAMDGQLLGKILPGMLESWVAKGSDELVVLVSEKDAKALEGFFREKLSAALKKGVELKPSKDIKAGFRIAEKNGSAYYDFSAESVSLMLGRYLNGRLAQIVAGTVT